MKKQARILSETLVSEINEVENSNFAFAESNPDLLESETELEETDEFIPLHPDTEEDDDDFLEEEIIQEQNNEEAAEPTEEEPVQEKTNLDEFSLNESELMQAFIKKEKERRKKMIANKIKALENEVALKQKKMDKEQNQIAVWRKEAVKLKDLELEKYNRDLVAKIIYFNETNTIEAKDQMISYYSQLIERLEKEKQAQIESGVDGNFSVNYQEYHTNRTARHNKRLQSLQRYYYDYCDNREIKINNQIGTQIKSRKKEIERLKAEINQ